MHIDAYLQNVREDLARMAALGDESAVRAGELLAAALESSLAQRMQEALTEAAQELSRQLPDGHVELRLTGRDPELVYVPEPATLPTPSPARGIDEGPEASGTGARITLRLPERLKARLEDAAGAAGVSVNTWLVQALGDVLQPHPPSTRTGGARHRLSGFGRA